MKVQADVTVLARVGMVLACALMVVDTARGQASITLTSPVSPVNERDGSEFATDTFGRGWTMDRLRDIAVEDGFAQPTAVDGVWYGTTTDSLAFYHVLFAGFNLPSYSMYFSHYDEGTPYGPLNPIPAATYSRLSMRASLPTAARDTLQISWTANQAEFPNNALFFQDTRPSVDGYRIYDIDLTSAANNNAEKVGVLAPAISLAGNPWQGLLVDLLVRPTLNFPVGTAHAVDWIRLYNPTDSPRRTINWVTTGVPADGLHSVQLFVDNNASGFDGALMHSAIANDGSYTINTAALPPGDHYFYLRVVRYATDTQLFSTVTTSGYSARVRILAPPVAVFTAPTVTSAQNFATAELGNAWDFSSSADTSSMFDIFNAGYASGILSAVAGSSDPQIILKQTVGGVVRPITTSYYRYLTFRMRVDTTGFGPHLDRVPVGWVARLFWGDNGGTSISKDVPLLEGWHRYSLDLWDANLPETAGVPAQSGWLTHSQVRMLRFDPLEVFRNTGFELDEVTLCGENRPTTSGRYLVQWTLSDPDNTSWTVKLYYGRVSALGVYTETSTPLLSRSQSTAAGSYSWHIGGLANGNYRLRLQVSDGTHVRSCFSPVHVAVFGAPAALWNAGATEQSGGWFALPWFGTYLELGATQPNWIWHPQHDYMWVEPSSTPNGIWFWTGDQGWLWTTSTWYPYIYRWDDGIWYWYAPGSDNPRSVLNTETLVWETW